MNLDSLLLGAATLAAVAALLCFAFAALRAGRYPARSCPRCRYDLAGAGPPPLTCPECGRVTNDERGLRRPRFARFGFRFGLLLLLLALTLLGWRFRGSIIRVALGPWRQLDAVTQGPWEVRLLERRDPTETPPEMPRRVEVCFAGDIVFVMEGFHLRAGAATLGLAAASPGPDAWPPPPRYPVATDSTRLPAAGSPGMLGDGDGDGRPDLAIEDPSAGSGGYTTTYLFSLEPTGTVVPTAILENAFMVRNDNDSAFDAIGFDPQYAYRWTSGAGSPRPRLVLAPDGSVPRSNWTCDAEAMRLASPSETQWNALLERVREGAARAAAETTPGESVSSEPWLAPLLASFCHLAYGGHPDLAWMFLAEAWPTGALVRGNPPLDREAFAAELAEALAASPCAEVLGFPGGPPPGPALPDSPHR